MLFIYTLERKSTIWHVGEKSPEIDHLLIKEYFEVQADNDELEYIKRKFTNIPMTNNKVISWYGDIAKFIAGNL